MPPTWDDEAKGVAVIWQQVLPVLLVRHHHLVGRVHHVPQRQRRAILAAGQLGCRSSQKNDARQIHPLV